MSSAIAILVRTPGLSPIKTRLASGIGEQRATEFHRLSSLAVAESARLSGATVYWAVAEESAVANSPWARYERIWQGEGSLGTRVGRLYRKLMGRHEDGVLLVAGDTPHIRPSRLVAAIQAMRGGRYVFGPANDGGFYLFGGTRPVPQDLWDKVTYGGADTGDQLYERLQKFGPVVRLETMYDVDQLEDLALLAHEFDDGQRARTLTVSQRDLLNWLRVKGLVRYSA